MKSMSIFWPSHQKWRTAILEDLLQAYEHEDEGFAEVTSASTGVIATAA